MIGTKRDARLELAWRLTSAGADEQLGHYDERNKEIWHCLSAARGAGYEVGIRLDKDNSEWPVVYIELPTGQVSFHLPQHTKEWDDHDTEEKWRRAEEFCQSVFPKRLK